MELPNWFEFSSGFWMTSGSWVPPTMFLWTPCLLCLSVEEKGLSSSVYSLMCAVSSSVRSPCSVFQGIWFMGRNLKINVNSLHFILVLQGILSLSFRVVAGDLPWSFRFLQRSSITSVRDVCSYFLAHKCMQTWSCSNNQVWRLGPIRTSVENTKHLKQKSMSNLQSLFFSLVWQHSV